MKVQSSLRVKTLFEQALDLPLEQRGAFLDAACAGEPDLRAEIESLLDYDSKFETGQRDEGFLKSQLVVSSEGTLRVQEALNSLDPVDREVLALRHFGRLSRGEAARGRSASVGMRRASDTSTRRSRSKTLWPRRDWPIERASEGAACRAAAGERSGSQATQLFAHAARARVRLGHSNCSPHSLPARRPRRKAISLPRPSARTPARCASRTRLESTRRPCAEKSCTRSLFRTARVVALGQPQVGQVRQAKLRLGSAFSARLPSLLSQKMVMRTLPLSVMRCSQPRNVSPAFSLRKPAMCPAKAPKTS